MLRALAVLALVACSGSSPPPPAPAAPLPPKAATIYWAEHQIPHIVAPDLETLAFAQGYAMARLHLCVVADQILLVRGERAAFFGPGDGDRHVNSDFGVRAVGYRERAEAMVPAASADTRRVIRGFAAGINRFIDQAGEHPAACKGAPWVRPVDELDVASYLLFVNNMAGSASFVGAIGRAVPAAEGAAALPNPGLDDDPWRAVGASNGWALGADKVDGGGAIVAGNPHFPWEGAHKFYEAHLVIPGELDAYGAALVGTPLINIGFNRSAGWTHTFSASRRFAVYRLPLASGEPGTPEGASSERGRNKTSYKHGRTTRPLEAKTIEIQVLRDGRLEPMSRTLYRSHHGPIIVTSSTPWDERYAYALGDATLGNGRAVDQYLAMMKAGDVAAIEAAIADHRGSAFVNTIAADAAGAAYYADSSLVPDFGKAGLAAFRLARKTIAAVEQAWQRGAIGVDGSLEVFDFTGPVPFERAPRLTRRDFVMNANDPYHATNPAEPLSGYSIFFGDPTAPLSPRTEMNLRLLGERARFSLDDVEAALVSNRGLVAEKRRAEVVKACKPVASLARPCAVLEAWDGRLDLDSAGAVLWRELLPLDGATNARLAAAAERLASAGVALDATLGAVQFFEKGGVRFPVHGGNSLEGTTNLAHYSGRTTTLLPGMDPGAWINRQTGLSARGYPVNYGTSFLFMARFRPGAEPEARGILVYGNSSDPGDTAQLELWAQKKLRPLVLSIDAVAAAPGTRVERVKHVKRQSR